MTAPPDCASSTRRSPTRAGEGIGDRRQDFEKAHLRDREKTLVANGAEREKSGVQVSRCGREVDDNEIAEVLATGPYPVFKLTEARHGLLRMEESWPSGSSAQVDAVKASQGSARTVPGERPQAAVGLVHLRRPVRCR